MKRSKFLSILIAIAIIASLFQTNVIFPQVAYGQEINQAGTKIRLGAEVLLEDPEYRQLIEGKNVALVTNQIGVDQQMNHLIDTLANDKSFNLVSLFAGEHGIRGNYQAGAAVPSGKDPETGIWVWSLYGSGNPSRPTNAMLENVDVLLFDLQEIGSRTWTYMYLMADIMRSCIESTRAGHPVKFVVLDRPNPLGGLTVEGPILEPANASGISRFPLPSRYGMTMGELAKLYVGEYSHWGSPAIPFSECDLTVVPCKGWTRDMYWDDTDLQWVLPSPNMPSYEAALAYAGTVWHEGTNLAEGRGTTLPFLTLSAPYVNPIELAQRLNELNLPGVRYRAMSITPFITNQACPSTYIGNLLNGVQIHVNDKYTFSPIDAMIVQLLTLKSLYGSAFSITTAIDARVGNSWVRAAVNSFPQYSTNDQILTKLAELKGKIQKDIDAFLPIREKYLIDTYATSQTQPKPVAPSNIKLGYEVLLSEHRDLVEEKRVGLVTNQTGVDKQMNHIADVLKANGVNLTTLFSPGFGVRGEKTAGSASYIDGNGGTGLTVYRLYGDTPRPTADMLANVDVLLYDLQDLGSSYYPYINLLADCMLSSAENNVKFVVLDRPNPLSDSVVEGPVANVADGAVGYPIPIRYGMTLGELAMMFREEYGHYSGASLSNLDLTVVKMKGWNPDMYWDETGLQFVMPSQEIPTFKSALIYAGTSMVKGTTMLEGWGTTKSYEYIGAPFIQPKITEYAKNLNDLNLPGVRFRAASFTPWYASSSSAAKNAGVKYSGVGCFGTQIHVYDEHAFSPIDTTLAIFTTLQKMFPNDLAGVFTDSFDKTVGNTWLKDMIKSGASVSEIKARYQPDLDAFMKVRQNYLLYPVMDLAGATTSNGQGDINFPIKSANGKGYTVYISDVGPNGPFKIANVNFDSKGAHVKGLTNDVKYYAYVVYSSDKDYQRSDVIMLLPSKK